MWFGVASLRVFGDLIWHQLDSKQQNRLIEIELRLFEMKFEMGCTISHFD